LPDPPSFDIDHLILDDLIQNVLEQLLVRLEIVMSKTLNCSVQPTLVDHNEVEAFCCIGAGDLA
jgi:hypothetical protein